MRTLVKDSIKLMTEHHVALLSDAAKSGISFTEGEHVALAIHGLSLQLAETAAALNRIYQTLETAKNSRNA